MEMQVTYYKGVLDLDPKPHPVMNQGGVFFWNLRRPSQVPKF